MEFSFDDKAFNTFLNRIGISVTGSRLQLTRGVLITVAVCWAPLALITLINGTFWTGNIGTSFITNFDTQVRILISLPVLILSEKLISMKLGLILGQFKNSGIIHKDEHSKFDNIIHRNMQFLKSKWTFIGILLFCYLQVFLVLFYKSESTSMLSWQVVITNGEELLNLAGKWSTLISRPIVLFLFLRWLLRIIVWGWMLRKISRLNLNLFAVHPDLAGGLGFLGYALRFFSPVAFAISSAIAGNMIDFILIEGSNLDNLKLPAIGYFIFISILFALPLFSFSGKLINAREESVFENHDFANGMYRELRKRLSKGFDKVTSEDLKLNDYSAVGDLNAVIDNALNMKFIPFTLKDFFPLWVMTAIPFLAVIVMEIPVNELFKDVILFLV